MIIMIIGNNNDSENARQKVSKYDKQCFRNK